MNINIISPNGVVFKGKINSVVLPTYNGHIGILKNHAPLITTLGKGKIKTRLASSSEEKYFDVDGGIVEVLNNVINVVIK